MRERSDYEHEYRIILPDGTIKCIHSLGHPVVKESGNLEFIGTVMDITERKRAEDALHQAQAELARVTRVLTLGALMTSIAHEVNQPLTAIMNNANASLRWLGRATPDLEAAQEALRAIMRNRTWSRWISSRSLQRWWS